MNKIQDGFFAGGDSYKPLVISSDRQTAATVSFVEDRVIIRGMRGSSLEMDADASDGEIIFRITEAAEAV